MLFFIAEGIWMSTNMQRWDQTPPPLDEGYWSALLHEGEFTESSPEESEIVEDITPQDTIKEMHPQSNAQSNMVIEDWQDIEATMLNDEVIELHVIGYNRGGILVEWRSLHGFVPASQLTDFPATVNSTVRRNLLQEMIGKMLKLHPPILHPP